MNVNTSFLCQCSKVTGLHDTAISCPCAAIILHSKQRQVALLPGIAITLHYIFCKNSLELKSVSILNNGCAGGINTSKSWAANRHTVWCTSPVSQCTPESGWGLTEISASLWALQLGKKFTFTFYVRFTNTGNIQWNKGQISEQQHTQSTACYNLPQHF